jgi:UDP-N-acetylglucosamine--N-acetylmuramyl-(pentapeptide) pyrophosphoryl-undecaprenol N-acetylglucosamine transferase
VAAVAIMAGGTGGHVFPGLAVASVLQERGVPVVWFGTPQGLESRLVPDAGLVLHTLPVQGLRGRGLGAWLSAPWRLQRPVFMALRQLRRLRPRVVLGFGGYVTGPTALAARLLRIPLIIHEQNAVAGLTNRLLARFSATVLCGFPHAFPPGPTVHWVGNPVRLAIAALASGSGQPPADVGGRRLRMLVIGGSQGALALNRAVPEAIARLPEALRPRVRHQAGERTLPAARDAYCAAGLEAEVVPFIDDMAEAYAWADLVVCRAGALTVTELAAVGVPAILVPFPQAVDDHQTANARHLVAAGAAWLLPQREVEQGELASLLLAIATEPERLSGMRGCARGLAPLDAAQRIADQCLGVL